MSKTSNPNKKSKFQSKTNTLFMTTKDLLSWRTSKPSLAFIHNLGDAALEWVRKDSSEDLIDFTREFGIPYHTYEGYCKLYPELAAVHDEVMATLGCRRQKMAMHRELNCEPKTIHHTLRLYHPSWRKLWLEDIAQRMKEKEALQEAVGNATFLINANPIPKTEEIDDE